MKSLIHKTRIFLIRFGKIIPFVLCFIVFISYLENLVALSTEDYLMYNGFYVLNKPISYLIGSYFEYNALFLSFLIVVSFAIETCIYNKLAIFYLAINLYEKSYFTNHVYENNIYYIVAIINALICVFFGYKGIKILRK